RLSLQFADGSAHATDCLIVADGIHSAIRSQLAPDAVTRYAGYTCWRAVIDDPGLSLSAATETWGKHGRFGIVPLAGGKIYCFACINAPQNDPRMAAMRVAELKKIFSGYHAPIPAILEQWRDDQLIWNDLADLKPLDRFAYGRVVLIGDAAHATTPNLGQGACQAIEDAVILAEMLKKHSDPEQAFRAYEQKRLPRTRFIVETSRRMGAIAQWQNPLLVCLRNVLFRLIPQSVNEKQLHQLLSVRFEE
ncbi:MAG TPA: FAD-dependent monooxygenase, partial [Saprospiraceae bacterium]|nr:FAD-dependent monooxygenase [Saprospiraceae bacterium]